MAVAIVRDISCTRSAERFVLFSLFCSFCFDFIIKGIRYDTNNVYICKQNKTDRLLGVLGRRKFPLSRWQKIIEMKATFYDEIVMLSPLGNPLNYK